MDIKTAKKWIEEADAILIGAGAGISTDAGNDYLDEEAFKRRFPAMHKRGYRYPYQFIGKRDWSENLKWGYMSSFYTVIHGVEKSEVYTGLLEIVKNKDYFVVTSNVDEFFPKNGFDKLKYYTPQGSFENLQCLRNCKKKVWKSDEKMKELYSQVNFDTQEIKNSEILPKCPDCGSAVFFNVRGGDWFEHSPYDIQEKRLNEWLLKQKDKKLLVFSIGCGFNTPSVIRWRMEGIVGSHKNGRFIRVNPVHDKIPRKFREEKNGISLKLKSLEAVRLIKKEFEK